MKEKIIIFFKKKTKQKTRSKSYLYFLSNEAQNERNKVTNSMERIE